MKAKPQKRVIGLALGSGSARGLSHIGVISELRASGIVPDVVCGTSVGAMVAASWVTGRMEKLEAWAGQLTRLQTARFLDINARFDGFLDLSRFGAFLSEFVAADDELIEDCTPRFGAVATELMTARERWLTRGSLKEAVWASMSLPGLFPARKFEGTWLTDGGLLNPVPISLCHALGANYIIAVNLNADIVSGLFPVESNTGQTDADATPVPDNRAAQSPDTDEADEEDGLTRTFTNITREYATSIFSPNRNDNRDAQAPSVLNTVAAAINITQDRITRSRMAGDPPDILLAPRLGDIGLLELTRADEAIAEGAACVRRMLPEIERLLGSSTGADPT